MLEEIFVSNNMERNLGFLLEFDESVVVDFVEFETTGSVDLEGIVELSNFIVGEFSIVGEGDGLVVQ